MGYLGRHKKMGEFDHVLFDKMGGVFDLNQKVINKDIILF